MKSVLSFVLQLHAVIFAGLIMSACGSSNTLTTTGNGSDGTGIQINNGSLIIGDMGSNTATFTAGGYQMSVIVGQNIVYDDSSDSETGVSNTIATIQYLDSWDE